MQIPPAKHMSSKLLATHARQVLRNLERDEDREDEVLMVAVGTMATSWWSSVVKGRWRYRRDASRRLRSVADAFSFLQQRHGTEYITNLAIALW